MPRLTGILETVLYVGNLERAAAFYEDVLELPCMFKEARMRAYDVAGRGALLLFVRGQTLQAIETPSGTIPPHDGEGPLHVAFSIARQDYEAWERRLGEKGVAIEGRMTWKRGGASLYFRDPDDNLLELATPGLWPGY